MEFSSSPESGSSGYYRSRRRDDRVRKDHGRAKEPHKYRNHRYSRSRSRSYSKERQVYRRSPERDLYKDLIDQDYGDAWDRNRDRERPRHRSRDKRSRDRERESRRGGDREKSVKRAYSPSNHMLEDLISGDSDNNEYFYHQNPNNKIIVRGLAPHITEADINSDLIQCGLQPLHVRLIRRKKTGASRGFAFVEFRTEEEATRWICYKQGLLVFNDHRAIMQYTYITDFPVPIEVKVKDKPATDWYCGKCGVFNFKRRENCFKCCASREESEKGGEGSDEISNILTKKIMLRNLDVLSNEERVLCVMQEVVPALVVKISKILICRDPLTSTSRGICYLHFDNLVDSMNTHNALKALEIPLKIDNREILISYCMDTENRSLVKNASNKSQEAQPSYVNTYQYTLADVPRLAEYSASMYASNTAEHEHYIKFYTNYYISQITQGHMSNLPTMSQLGETANSGAAVAQSAMQRVQKAQKVDGPEAAPAPVKVQQPVQLPNGTDGKKYPIPDVSLYQYDETSGFYYDPSTGLYYDSQSQYYYNNETNSYLYWDNDNSTYVAAPTSSQSTSAGNPSTTVTDAPENIESLRTDNKNKSKEQHPHDKVKVAKKIVKDMEKWAKQLNQKKDYNIMHAPANASKIEDVSTPSMSLASVSKMSEAGGYADVGFALLEKKERVQAVSNYLMSHAKQPTINSNNKLVPSYGSDSDNDADDSAPITEKDYVDFEKLTCLLCKRAFQSLEILNKHLKMSALHKENLQKFNAQRENADVSGNGKGGYRDRAKERRLKYGEADPPPVNRSKERFQREIEKQAAFQPNNVADMPIGENNVGNKLLQKMGWSEGQGLGRSNQGRTNIIEAETRVSNAGLGSKCSTYGTSGDDYKTYIKRMMKSRYEQVDMKD